jgi:hypothetical protein
MTINDTFPILITSLIFFCLYSTEQLIKKDIFRSIHKDKSYISFDVLFGKLNLINENNSYIILT